MKLFRQKIAERMGTEDEPYTTTLPTASTQPSAATVYHAVQQDDGSLLIMSPDLWRTHQTERGICWICGDQLPIGAHFCITCGAETAPATGETERLYVAATGKTERL